MTDSHDMKCQSTLCCILCMVKHLLSGLDGLLITTDNTRDPRLQQEHYDLLVRLHPRLGKVGQHLSLVMLPAIQQHTCFETQQRRVKGRERQRGETALQGI